MLHACLCSCVLPLFEQVVLLVGFIAVILMKVLKSDYARYQAMDEEADGNVFRSMVVRDMNHVFPTSAVMITHMHNDLQHTTYTYTHIHNTCISREQTRRTTVGSLFMVMSFVSLQAKTCFAPSLALEFSCWPSQCPLHY